jgi:hypothetical protein
VVVTGLAEDGTRQMFLLRLKDSRKGP